MPFKFYLQLFADADTDSNSETNSQDRSSEDETKDRSSEKKYTDAELDEIINKKFARWQEKKQKEIDEAKKLERMDAQQRAEHERDTLKAELEEYKRKNSIAEMTKTARKMLSDDGISVSDAVDAAVKDKLKGAPPKRGTSGGATAKTREEILAIKDPELRQRLMLQNRELFNF